MENGGSTSRGRTDIRIEEGEKGALNECPRECIPAVGTTHLPRCAADCARYRD